MKAKKVLNRVEEILGRTFANVTFEPEESGFVVSCTVELQSSAWNDAVVELIELGFRIADIWRLTGAADSVRKQFEGDASQTSLFKVAGIKAADWWIGKGYETS